MLKSILLATLVAACVIFMANFAVKLLVQPIDESVDAVIEQSTLFRSQLQQANEEAQMWFEKWESCKQSNQ